MTTALLGGFYRLGKSRVILLCGVCAEKRGFWPADLMIQREQDDHADCSDCGEPVA